MNEKKISKTKDRSSIFVHFFLNSHTFIYMNIFAVCLFYSQVYVNKY